MSAPGENLQSRVTGLVIAGIYEPGSYARKDDLTAGQLTAEPDGSVWFDVETVTPNTDRERVRVTVSRPS